MELPVLIEPTPDGRYRARSGEPLVLTATGATADEALGELRRQFAARLDAGTQIVPMGVPPAAWPWDDVLGMFKDDPLFDEWQAAIAEHRRERDGNDEEP